jgi:hypothetical protein
MFFALSPDRVVRAAVATAVFWGASIALGQTRPPGDAAVQQLLTSPLAFEENQGQADPSAHFLARSPAYSMFLTPEHVEFVFPLGHDRANANRSTASQPVSVLMEFVDSGRDTKMAGEELAPGRINYYLGNQPGSWRQGVPQYRNIFYSWLYPGIDLTFDGNPAHLEYDFAVAPRGDPTHIGLKTTVEDQDRGKHNLADAPDRLRRWRKQ